MTDISEAVKSVPLDDRDFEVAVLQKLCRDTCYQLLNLLDRLEDAQEDARKDAPEHSIKLEVPPRVKYIHIY